MKKIKYYALLISILMISACGNKDNPTSDKPQEKPKKQKVLKERLSKNSLSYIDKYNKEHLYSLSIPDDYENRKDLPVIVYLHGSGGDENSDLIDFSHYVDKILNECSADRPLIVFPSDNNRLFVQDQNYHIARGLLEEVEKNYSIANPERRIITGFSNGGAAATRAAIVNPGSFALSYSWAGWVWSKDKYLFDATKENAVQLRQQSYKAVLVTGDKDEPRAYDLLINVMKDNNIDYNHVVLKNQSHNLGHYFKKSRELFKTDLCRLFVKQ